MQTRRRTSPLRHQRLECGGEYDDMSELLLPIKKKITIPRINPKKNPLALHDTNQNQMNIENRSCLTSFTKLKGDYENGSPSYMSSSEKIPPNDSNSFHRSFSASFSKTSSSQHYGPLRDISNNRSTPNGRGREESVDESKGAMNESSVTHCQYQYGQQFSTNHVEMDTKTGTVNHITSQPITHTPKPLLRNLQSALKSTKKQNESNPNISFNTTNSRKKIQWDESILNHTRDIDDEKELRKGIEVVSSQQIHRYNRKYPTLQMKRFDEFLQHDVVHSRSNTVSSPYESQYSMSSSTNTSSDNSISQDSNSIGSASTSKSSILLNSKDTTCTIDEINECVQDVLDQSMAEAPLKKVSKRKSYRKKHILNTSTMSNITNITAEIAECVADINDQTMTYVAADDHGKFINSTSKKAQSSTCEMSFNTNITAEIAECVADIKDQTMALNEDVDKAMKFSKRKVLSNAPVVSHVMNITAEIAECVADIKDQSMVFSPIQVPSDKSFNKSSLMNKTSAEISEGVADVMEQSVITKHENITDSLTDIKNCSAFDLSSIHGSSNESPKFKDCVEYNDSQIETSRCNQFVGSANVAARKMGNILGRPQDLLQIEKEFPFSPIFTPRSKHTNGSDQSTAPSLDESFVSATSSNLNSVSLMKAKMKDSREINKHKRSSYVMQLVDRLHLLSQPVKPMEDEEQLKWEESKEWLQTSYASMYESCNSFEMQNRSDYSTGERSPDVAANLIKIGISLLNSGQYEESILTFKEALRIRQKKYGYNHPLVAKIHNNLGVAYLNLQRYDKGLLSFQNALNSHNNALSIILDIGDEKNHALIKKFDLEIVEMLKNLGSVCLDWIDKNPPAIKHIEKLKLSEKAEHAFRRALTIQLHYLDTFDTAVRDTIKMCEEAKISCNYFSDNKSAKSDSQALKQKKNVDGGVIKESRPFDERTFHEFPSDELSRWHFPTLPSPLPHYLHDKRHSTSLQLKGGRHCDLVTPNKEIDVFDSKLLLFSHGGPCQMKIIDSDIKDDEEKYESTASAGKSREYLHDLPNALSSTDQLNSSLILALPRESREYVHAIPEALSSIVLTSSSPISVNQPIEREEISATKASNPSNSPSPSSYSIKEPLEQSTTKLEDENHALHYQGEKRVSVNKSIILSNDEKQLKSIKHCPSYKITYNPDDNQPLTHHEPKRQLNVTEEMNLGHEESIYNVTTSDFNMAKSRINVESLLDQSDEIASSSVERTTRRNASEQTMLSNPKEYHHEIHVAAVQSLKAGQHEKSKALFEVLLSTYKSIHGELHHTIGSTYHNLGIVLLRSEKYEEALEYFQKASRVRKGSIGRDHADVAISLVKVGITHLLLRRFDDALLTFREALSIRRHAMGHLHPSTARIYNNIGCVHVEFNEMREARRAFEAALDVQRNALCYEPNSSQLQFGTATTLCNLGYLYTYRGQNEKACLVLKEAAELQEQVIGHAHPTVLSTLDALADSYSKHGDNVNAMSYYKEIIARLQSREKKCNELSQRKQRALAIVHYKTSRVHRKQNDLQAALRELKQSWCFVKDIGSPELLNRIKNEIQEVKTNLKTTYLDWL